MSLITCPECGKQISDKATACPHCGNPMHMLFDISKYEIASDYKVKKCSGCGREIPKMLAKCPYCGKNQRAIAGIVGTVLLIIMLLRVVLLLGGIEDRDITNEDFTKIGNNDITVYEAENVESKVVCEKTYKMGSEKEQLTYALLEGENGKYCFSIKGYFEEEWKAAYVFTLFEEVFQTDEYKSIGYTSDLKVNCGNIYLSLTEALNTVSQEKIDVSEWCDEKMEESNLLELALFSKKLSESLEEFEEALQEY